MSNSQIVITVCGDGSCGKSTIASQLARCDLTQKHDVVVANSYTITRRINGGTIQAKIIDTPGRRSSISALDASTLKSDAFMLVYDITSVPSLTNLQHFSDLITIETEERLDLGLTPPVKMVVGNKTDLRREYLQSAQVGTLRGMSWAKRRGYEFTEVTARDAFDVERVFHALLRRVLEERGRHMSDEPEPTVVYRSPNGALLSGFALGVTRPLTPLNDIEAGQEQLLKKPKRRFWRWLCWK